MASLASIDRFGSFAGEHERQVTGTQPHAIGPPHCGHWWVTLYAALLSFNVLLEMSVLGRELPVFPKI